MSTRNAPENIARGKMSTVKVQESIYQSYLRQTRGETDPKHALGEYIRR